MSIRILCGSAGSPGVTATALGCTLTHPGPTLLVDGSCDGSQAILAGFLGGASAAGVGIEEFARRTRMGASFDLIAATIPLDGGQGHHRLMPGFGHLGAVDLFEGSWPTLAEELRRVADSGIEVIVDAGRVGDGTRMAALLARADEVTLVARTGLRHLAAARAACDRLDELLTRGPRVVTRGLALVGEGRPYDRREVEHLFGWPTRLVLPWLPDHAAVLTDGAPPPRRWQRSPLLAACRAHMEEVAA